MVRQATHLQIGGLATALDLFKMDIGRYPTTEEGLMALVKAPATIENWNGPYVKKTDSLVDAWGRAYRYRSPGEHEEFDLYSQGSTGKDSAGVEDSRLHSW